MFFLEQQFLTVKYMTLPPPNTHTLGTLRKGYRQCCLDS